MNGSLGKLPPSPDGSSFGWCSCSPDCSRYLWGNDPVVRNLRGGLFNLGCAVKVGLSTWDAISATDYQSLPVLQIEHPRDKEARKQRERRQRKRKAA
jgi:hypothetical protein